MVDSKSSVRLSGITTTGPQGLAYQDIEYTLDAVGNVERYTNNTYGDHLGSAQLVTDWSGSIYEHLEYTPYGELWVDHATSEVGMNPTIFRFTGKVCLHKVLKELVLL